MRITRYFPIPAPQISFLPSFLLISLFVTTLSAKATPENARQDFCSTLSSAHSHFAGEGHAEQRPQEVVWHYYNSRDVKEPQDCVHLMREVKPVFDGYVELYKKNKTESEALHSSACTEGRSIFSAAIDKAKEAAKKAADGQGGLSASAADTNHEVSNELARLPQVKASALQKLEAITQRISASTKALAARTSALAEPTARDTECAKEVKEQFRQVYLRNIKFDAEKNFSSRIQAYKAEIEKAFAKLENFDFALQAKQSQNLDRTKGLGSVPVDSGQSEYLKCLQNPPGGMMSRCFKLK